MTPSNAPVRERAPQPARRPLSEEQCDRCCAPACVRVELRSGLDLVFCGHHARQYDRVLQQHGAKLRGGFGFWPRRR